MNIVHQHTHTFEPPPHLLNNRRSPSRNTLSSPPTMSTSNRKRKADDDGPPTDDVDDRMSASPSAPAPSILPRPPPTRPSTKRMRTNITGRPLPLTRLLETLDADEMRRLLASICERHPSIGADVTSTAPRPSVASTLGVLAKYEAVFREAFPIGRNTSDYTYNRVRQQLVDLLDALKDFTPHFLPPHEVQPATSLAFLDGATEFIHRIPDWESFAHNRHKQEAYEEMAKAWAAVIREAAKKAGGMQLQYGGWDQKIMKHNEASGGQMQEAVNALRGSLGWMGTGERAGNGAGGGFATGGGSDTQSIRQQLLNGTYGMGSPMPVGHW